MFKLILDHVVGIFLLAFLLYSFYWNLTRLGSFLACFKVKNCVNNNCVFSGVCPKWEESYTEEEIQELTRQAEELEQDTGVYESEYPEDTKEAADDQEERRSITDTELLIAAVAALAAGGITAGNIIVKYRLRFGGYRYPVEKNGNLNLRIQEDRLVNQFVKKRDISK